MLPRFVPLADGPTFVPLEELIAKHLDQLFPGMEIVDHAVFRVTRDADFTVSDEADDLLAGGRGRAAPPALRRGRAGRGRVEHEPAHARAARARAEAEDEDVFEVDGLLDLNDLWEIVKIPGYAELRDVPWTPLTQPRLQARGGRGADVMAAMREGDILCTTPTTRSRPRSSVSSSRPSTTPTCSRSSRPCTARATTRRSSGADPRRRARQAGGLPGGAQGALRRAREHQWARAMEEAGVHVVYGLPALKTHAKCILVIRREGDGIRHYVHVGTGNYHPKTARLYTDFGLLTCDDGDRRRRRRHVQLPHRLRAARGATARCSIAPAHLRDGIIERDRGHDRRAHEGNTRGSA